MTEKARNSADVLICLTFVQVSQLQHTQYLIDILCIAHSHIAGLLLRLGNMSGRRKWNSILAPSSEET